MICQQCQRPMHGRSCEECGWAMPVTEFHGGQTLRLNACDVPGCQRIVSAGDPAQNLEQGLKLPTRCRFHRDPDHRDPPRADSSPVLADPGPLMTLDEFGREEFDRIRRASGEALKAYWKAHGIVVKPPTTAPKGWESAGKTMRKWADKWFPPIP